MKTGDLHLHCMDRYDSYNNPMAVCKREKELGAKAVALTQHGVNASKQDFRLAAEECGLKFIPGIESYVRFGDVLSAIGIKTDEKVAKKRCHLILLACDKTGDTAINKAVSYSQDQDGYAVMSLKVLTEMFGPKAMGHGRVIATSACIQGVIAMVLRLNDETETAITRLKKGIMDVDVVKLEKSRLEVSDLTNQIKNLTAAIKKESGAEKEKLQKEKEELSEKKKELSNSIKAGDKAIAKNKELSEKIAVLRKTLSTKEDLKAYAKKAIRYFEMLFGKDFFYVELQNHGMELEKEIYPAEAELARELGVPMVATNDVHIVDDSKEEILRRQILKSMRFKELPWEEPSAEDRELYIKTDEEMTEWLLKILPDDVVKEAMENIGKIIDRCNVVFEKESHYPKFKCKLGTEAQFDYEIKKGIKWRFPNGMDEEHQMKLEHEIKVIKSMGYSDYHLIVKDILEYNRLLGGVPADKISEAPLTIEELKIYIKKNHYEIGFSTGPGRGSAAGSLVCYLLGITSLDPLKYDLLFERFLNPERVSMPDIDSDMAYKTRAKTIEYIKNKYGEKAVCGITTKNALAAKGSLRTVSKYYAKANGLSEKVTLAAADKIAKAIPAEPNIKFATKLDKNDKASETVEQYLRRSFPDKLSNALIDWAKVLEGSFTSYGTHAAGVIISDNDDISDYIPLRWNKDLNLMTSQFDAVQAEGEGVLKIDCLGLRTLDVITDTIQLIFKNYGVVIDPLKIPLNDKEVYNKIFKMGMTNSVFQFESSGMKNMLKRFAPENFEDLIILVSMFRPGPLQYIDGVIEVKNGKEPKYLCDELKPILGDTYAAIVYQEQVMAIFQQLAGYTLGGADVVRRYMSKKKADELTKEREAFIYGDASRNIKGCVPNGISEEAASELFSQMEDFAEYAFNKSHAAAYANVAYITAWLKLHYTAEFLASAMNQAINKKIPGLMHEAKVLGIPVKAPDINRSEDKFTVIDGTIFFGMKAVKNVGKAATEIMEERKKGNFYSYENFISRCMPKKNVLESLCKAGALDSFSKNRTALCAIAEELKNAVKKVSERTDALETAVKTNPEKVEELKKKYTIARQMLDEITIPTNIPENTDKKMEEEKNLLGMYVTSHPIDSYSRPNDCEMIDKLTTGTYRIMCVLTKVDIKYRKKDGLPMAFCEAEDETGEISLKFFTEKYAFYKKAIKEGTVLLVSGKVTEEDTGLTDENDDPIMELSMIPDSVKFASKKKVTYRMKISSYPVFHVSKERAFMDEYKDENGCLLEFFDETEQSVRPVSYKVKPSVEKLPNVERI